MFTKYSEKLLDPRWQRKRLEILNRDNFSCMRCGDTKSTLHVHHRFYENGKDPWDYEDFILATLCEECHVKEHSDMGELSMFKYAIVEGKFTLQESIFLSLQIFKNPDIVKDFIKKQRIKK